MEWVVDILSWILLLAGGAFGLISGIGLIRFPDFYTRSHAAGVGDTLGIGLILLGLMLQADSWHTVVKLALILLILFFSAPTAVHAIARAAFAHGLQPLLHEQNVDPALTEGDIPVSEEHDNEPVTPA